jgi:ABC-type multidrug transport system fused ATPase/permease subunit
LKRIITNTIAILDGAERRKASLLIGLSLSVSVLDVGFLAALLFIVRLYSGTPMPKGLFPVWLTDPASLRPVVLFFVLFACKNFASYLVYRAQCRFRFQVGLRISHNNLLQYLEGSYTDHVHVDSAVHYSRINLQPAEFCEHVMQGLQQLISEWTLIGLTVFAILLFNAGLFLLLLLVMFPPIVIVSWLTRKQVVKAKENIAGNREAAWRRLEEGVNGFVESNVFGKHLFFAGRYHRAQREQNRHLSSLQTIQGAPSRLTEVFAVFGLLALICIAHVWGHPNGTGFVTLGAFLAAAYKIIPGIARILNLNGQLRAYSYTIDDLVKKRAREKTGQQGGPAGGIESIVLRDIHFRYGWRPILEEVDLEAGAGCFLGIEGDSGRGKTTLLNILLGFLEPGEGEILFNGRRMDARQLAFYREKIAYVKQQPFILHDTLLTNVTLEEEAPDAGRLARALAVSGLDVIAERLPNGMDTLISENGRNLSGGQRQRIAIARALYREADVFILDEPFSELDEDSESRLLDHFRQLAQEGRVVILVTHNKRSLGWCNKIFKMQETTAAGVKTEKIHD